nr:MAG TPA: hypothetical protein [Caudoviricetes sp.]DAU02136.1 MAG TPA: hypothetical protein [Caudoviricetes sp.]
MWLWITLLELKVKKDSVVLSFFVVIYNFL